MTSKGRIMTKATVKNSSVKEAASCSLKEPENIETVNKENYVYVVVGNFEGKENFYGLRNSKAFDFWDNPEEDIY